ncbi:MAG: hypothetical protein J1F32_06085 [Erysipelotrichales bacterium]|nr:hypothetical protein [Erysipelotrichales bacterium]
MKKIWIALPLLLLVACGNTENSNSPSVSVGDSTNETPVSVTPVSSNTNSETSNSEFVDNSVSLPNSEFVDDSTEPVITYSIIGCFMDNKNNPISNLTIGLYDVNKVEIDSATTDENGEFGFTGLLEGKYYFHILTSASDKYKDLDKEWSFEVSGEYFDLQLDTITLEIDNTKWSDLM